ncbi:hypothetical protein [Microbulbifer thermotolerans]|uniref:TM2 domain-containing protein n=1 Tax=Microbulbifer thermotolerans TaxID=252514 RepID=A0AB35HZE4_MICTH|nr:hypothetical protein [Microbulbifer thermotolerans]MCX2780400.1 hypothetical protein [Microbulbifer thermotolerans]MCX2802234.1 hypothetical protein [Microbulbifer thermotolerans]MCX2805928.1 hypothetical protein [Microbulbifer thermotolerans]
MSFSEKSRLTSFVLTLLFGPIGLFYSSTAGGLVLTIIAIISAPTIVGPIICWVLSILIGDHCTHKHNKGIRDIKTALVEGRQAR